MSTHHDDTTDFGYQRVSPEEKTAKVGAVFDSVADNYDVMNDLMSLGAHRLWKQFAIQAGHYRPGQKVLDLAGGTGDLSAKISPLVGDEGRVVLSDINSAMLQTGRNRLLDRGIFSNMAFVQANAESLPFPSNYFDRIIIGFGLRNVTDKAAALASMYRCLKPGGQLNILEFSKPQLPGLKTIYDIYSFTVLPALGKWIAKDSESYRYLAESIRMHPDQDTLKAMMETAGCEDCKVHNLTGGIVALHQGYKY